RRAHQRPLSQPQGARDRRLAGGGPRHRPHRARHGPRSCRGSRLKKLVVLLLVVLIAMAAGFVALAPRVIAPGLRMIRPISRIKHSQAQLEQMEARSSWKRLETETLSPEKLDRFFAVWLRHDVSRRGADRHLDRHPRKH